MPTWSWILRSISGSSHRSWRARADVVYGSRFLDGSHHIPVVTRLANRFLTALTHLLFGARLTDMETADKALRRDAVAPLRLRCVGFDFEPEITARLLPAGHRIHEAPVSYRPRSHADGKKLALLDGVDAVYALLRCWVQKS
jgi:dolichol-phosphate mannosyltransferase